MLDKSTVTGSNRDRIRGDREKRQHGTSIGWKG
jgi:hypothetical protein